MKKNNNKAKALKTYLSGRFSQATEQKVQDWILQEESDPEMEAASLEYWEQLSAKPDRRLKTYWRTVSRRTAIGKERGVVSLRTRLLRVAAVAIPVLLLLGGGYYFVNRVSMINIQVAAGEQQHFFLPDSSEVWINSGSRLSFPDKFADGTRKISLEGEAYFSVKTDSARPFEVHTANLSVRVLGTKFNVREYKDEYKAVATLSSGKITVWAGKHNERILSPSEQLVYDRTSAVVSVDQVIPSDAIAWTKGNLVFTNAALEDIIRSVERTFNVAIQTNMTAKQMRELYTIKFMRDESIRDVMNVLSVMTGFSYSIREDVIMINKK